MKAPTKQILKEEVILFLKANRIAIISTISPENKPASAVVFYTIDNNFNFYFFTKDDSKKYTNLEKDNSVAVVVYDEDHPRIVQAEGFATVETNHEVIKKITATLLRQSALSSTWYDPPIAKMTGGNLAIVKIHTNYLRFGDFRGVTGHPNDVIFEQIIP